MSNQDEFSLDLDRLAKTSLRFRKEKIENVKLGMKLAEAFVGLDKYGRSNSIERISSQLGFKLLVLSGYMAEVAIDKQSTSYIKFGILMHIIENFRNDYRENYRYLVLLYYSAMKLNKNLSDIYENLASVATDVSRKYLDEFMNRDRSLNDIGLFGIKQVSKDGYTTFTAIDERFLNKKRIIT